MSGVIDTTEDELLEAITRAPEDWAPYLVYADVLTTRRDPRGELIVLQHKLATKPADQPNDAPEVMRWLQRERELSMIISKQLGLHWWTRYARGFVDQIYLSSSEATAHDATFQLPALRFVTKIEISGFDDMVRAVAKTPFVKRLRKLKAHGALMKLGPLFIANDRQLEDLDIHFNRLDDVYKTLLPRLKRLRVESPSYQTSDRLEPIISTMPELRHLLLDGELTPSEDFVRLLAESKLVRQLETLQIQTRTVRQIFVEHKEAFAKVRFVTNTSSAGTLCSVGNTLLALDRPAEALPLFEHAHLMDSGYLLEATQGVQDARQALGLPVPFVDAGDPIRDRDPARLPLLMRAYWEWTLFRERPQRGNGFLDRLLAAKPHHAGALIERAEAQLARGELEEGVATMGKTLAHEPISPCTDERIARAYAVRDDAVAVLALLEPAFQEESLHELGVVLFAFASIERKRFDDAREAVTRLLAPKQLAHVRAVGWLSEGFLVHARDGETQDEEARSAWRQAAAIVPADGDETYATITLTLARLFAATLLEDEALEKEFVKTLASWTKDYEGLIEPMANMILVPPFAHATKRGFTNRLQRSSGTRATRFSHLILQLNARQCAGSPMQKSVGVKSWRER